MKEMKKRKNLIIGMAMLGIACVSVGAATAKPLSANAGTAETAETATQGLPGFTSPGASVFISTDGSGMQQMRFQVNLASTVDETYKTAAESKSLTSGVVVLPYDIYMANEYKELTKETSQAVTASVMKNWESDGKGGYQSYAYINPKAIPKNQHNRTLIARGYIEVDGNVYYTEPARASMAYVAWKNINMAGGQYVDELNEYRGPYTLSYKGGNIPGEYYYGETFELPTTINDCELVDSWYWDEARTDAIKEGDYATGTMPVYYKLKEFTVSGKISCADTVDLKSVKVFAGEKDLNVSVDDQGEFDVKLESGRYDFVFRTNGYVAFKSVDLTEDTSLDDIVLSKNSFEIGNYKGFKTSTGKGAGDALSGTFSDVTGGQYTYTMPNTATTGAFEFSATMTKVERKNDEANFGIAVSNGTERLAFAFRKWGQIIVSSSTGIGEGIASGYYSSNTDYVNGVTVKIKRTSDKIELYRESKLMLTVTANGIVGGAAKADTNVRPDNLTSDTKELAKYFGAEKELCVGFSSVSTQTGTMTYAFSLAQYVDLKGTISAPQDASLTLADTKLTVDGIPFDVTVQDGVYTASVPEGTHTLTFDNGAYCATQKVTIGSGSNTVDVALAYATWRAGNYGSVKSTTTPAYNANGEYTISGTDQLVLFPNTARSDSFTYRVDVSNVTRAVDGSTIGICLTDGNYKLVVTYRAQRNTTKTAFSFDLFNGAGFDSHAVFATTEKLSEEFSLKLVVTKESIKFYYGEDRLIFTITKDSFVSTVKNTFWSTNKLITSVNGELTQAYKDRISGFFATGAQIAVGINSGLQGAVTATYKCSITNN